MIRITHDVTSEEIISWEQNDVLYQAFDNSRLSMSEVWSQLGLAQMTEQEFEAIHTAPLGEVVGVPLKDRAAFLLEHPGAKFLEFGE
jgi:hypothetical protein